jgi:membrane associated rhomboid family serine protease
VEFPVTTVVAIATVLVSFGAFNDRSLMYRLIFNPYRAARQGELYRAFTHAFIHADIFHLILNMYVFWQFGRLVELELSLEYGNKGEYLYALLYLGGILFATLPGFAKHNNNEGYNSLGASGAVAAVIFAFILIHPNTELFLLFLPIPVPAYIFGVCYLALEFFLDRRGGSYIAHDAHFWGAIFGIVFMSIVDINLLTNFIDQF